MKEKDILILSSVFANRISKLINSIPLNDKQKAFDEIERMERDVFDRFKEILSVKELPFDERSAHAKKVGEFLSEYASLLRPIMDKYLPSERVSFNELQIYISARILEASKI